MFSSEIIWNKSSFTGCVYYNVLYNLHLYNDCVKRWAWLQWKPDRVLNVTNYRQRAEQGNVSHAGNHQRHTHYVVHAKTPNNTNQTSGAGQSIISTIENPHNPLHEAMTDTKWCSLGLSLAGAATSIFFLLFLRQKYACCHDKIMFVATTYFCHDKTFVTTNIILLRHMFATTNICHNQIFVATNIILSWQKCCRDKHTFVTIKEVFFCAKNNTYGSSHQRYGTGQVLDVSREDSMLQLCKYASWQSSWKQTKVRRSGKGTQTSSMRHSCQKT